VAHLLSRLSVPQLDGRPMAEKQRPSAIQRGGAGAHVTTGGHETGVADYATPPRYVLSIYRPPPPPALRRRTRAQPSSSIKHHPARSSNATTEAHSTPLLHSRPESASSPVLLRLHRLLIPTGFWCAILHILHFFQSHLISCSRTVWIVLLDFFFS
jgi:hypothetical protein